MTLLGEKGLRDLAMVNHGKAIKAANRLTAIAGVEMVTGNFFNEFTLKLPRDARAIVQQLADQNILAGVSLGRLYPNSKGLDNGLVVAVTETVLDEDIEALATALEAILLGEAA